MVWSTQFKLGRPGYETLFDINPMGMDIERGQVVVMHSNLAGDLKKSVIKPNVPTIKINSNYLASRTLQDTFASYADVTDTFLSFICRTDWQTILEYNTPSTTTTVTIRNNSATRLSAALVAAGFSSIITINGVFIVADGSGTNYLNSGTYADATRVITLGTALPNATQPVYVTYTYTGWLVNFIKPQFKYSGGWIDKTNYDYTLEGA